ncbi:hypothetical protein ACWD4O_43930 [Streptomyces sp. NPDC002623]
MTALPEPPANRGRLAAAFDRLLFHRAVDVDRPEPAEDRTMKVFVLCKRANATRRRAFFRSMPISVDADVSRLAPRLRIDGYRRYHDASANGLVTAGYMLARTHANTAFLRRVRGEGRPQNFRTSLRPVYDAMLELTFSGPLDPAQVEAFNELTQALRGLCSLVDVIESPLRRRLRVGADSPRAVHLIELVNRVDGWTRPELQRYWIAPHGHLVVDNRQLIGYEEYQQVHVPAVGETALPDCFDGFAWVRWPSLRHYVLANCNPKVLRFNNELVVDESRFMQQVRAILVREQEVSTGTSAQR